MRKEDWKQPHPNYQARAIMAGLIGYVELLEHEHFNDPEERLRIIKNARVFADELLELTDNYMPKEW